MSRIRYYKIWIKEENKEKEKMIGHQQEQKKAYILMYRIITLLVIAVFLYIIFTN